jgi:hypothetical protein
LEAHEDDVLCAGAGRDRYRWWVRRRDSAPAGKGGAAAGGSTGLGGAVTGTGGSSTGTGGVATGVGGAGGGAEAGPAACIPFAVPNQNITDFTNFSPTATGGSWGDPMSLTGGTFLYQGTGDAPAIVFDATAANPSLGITATVPAGSYAGFGFYFGPACVDASMYTGLTFTMGGALGGAAAVMQLQTDEDYPVDITNMKGHCPGTFSSGCGFPSANLTVANPGVATPIPFATFMGGKPMATVDPQKLVGIQWQFNCPATDAGTECDVSITLDDVHFVM